MSAHLGAHPFHPIWVGLSPIDPCGQYSAAGIWAWGLGEAGRTRGLWQSFYPALRAAPSEPGKSMLPHSHTHTLICAHSHILKHTQHTCFARMHTHTHSHSHSHIPVLTHAGVGSHHHPLPGGLFVPKLLIPRQAGEAERQTHWMVRAQGWGAHLVLTPLDAGHSGRAGRTAPRAAGRVGKVPPLTCPDRGHCVDNPVAPVLLIKKKEKRKIHRDLRRASSVRSAFQGPCCALHLSEADTALSPLHLRGRGDQGPVAWSLLPI